MEGRIAIDEDMLLSVVGPRSEADTKSKPQVANNPGGNDEAGARSILQCL